MISNEEKTKIIDSAKLSTELKETITEYTKKPEINLLEVIFTKIVGRF